MNDLTLYKEAHRVSGADAFRTFQQHGVLGYLAKHYDTLHTQGGRYIVDDIDDYIANHPAGA